jgi:hypothetical protein
MYKHTSIPAAEISTWKSTTNWDYQDTKGENVHAARLCRCRGCRCKGLDDRGVLEGRRRNGGCRQGEGRGKASEEISRNVMRQSHGPQADRSWMSTCTTHRTGASTPLDRGGRATPTPARKHKAPRAGCTTHQAPPRCCGRHRPLRRLQQGMPPLPSTVPGQLQSSGPLGCGRWRRTWQEEPAGQGHLQCSKGCQQQCCQTAVQTDMSGVFDTRK